MQWESTKTLLQTLKQLQISSEYSDLKLFCGSQVFQVHKALVCPRSKFFATACEWGKNGQPRGEIDLEGDDPKIVKLMIDYLYQLDYSDVLPDESPPDTEELLPREPDSPVARTVQFFENIASGSNSVEPAENDLDPEVEWAVPKKIRSKKKKKRPTQRDDSWNTRLTHDIIDVDQDAVETNSIEEALAETIPEVEPEALSPSKEVSPEPKLRLQDCVCEQNTDKLTVNADLYALADKYEIEDLKLLAKAKFSKAAAQNWKSEAFVRAAELVFKNTPSTDLGLREVIVDTLYEHQELADYEEVETLLDSGNGIAWQFVKALLSRPQPSEPNPVRKSNGFW